jgi:nitrite reductase/ring-hydroxylating ferredoxin subunit
MCRVCNGTHNHEAGCPHFTWDVECEECGGAIFIDDQEQTFDLENGKYIHKACLSHLTAEDILQLMGKI